MPDKAPPKAALATLRHDRFFRPGWIYERKLDGERCLARKHDGVVRLWGRSGRDISEGFPELVAALEAQDTPDFEVDGEVVAFEGSRTSFGALQPRINVLDARRSLATGVKVFYYLFDAMSVDGVDIRREPLLVRKGLLRDLVDFDDPLRYTVHRTKADDAYFRDICARGWEGLIAKKADSRYVPGRTDTWLKFKCESGQEFVVGGWTDPENSRVGLGALLLGYYRDGDLHYAGKVGTGFSQALLRDLSETLAGIGTTTCPFAAGDPPTATSHWVRPTLVCEVAFSEWTKAGRLRHPRFVGLRRDKQAADVVRE